MATVDKISDAAPAPGRLATRWKILISAVLLVHMIALIAAPMAAGPSSQLEQQIANSFSWYTTFLYLNHGYRFFCPEPSPGHLVRYTLTMPDGSVATDEFPNLKTEWPRLLYHRFFMLSEKLARLMPEPIPDDAPEEVKAELKRDRPYQEKIFDDTARSYAAHLMKVAGAKSVTIDYVEHDMPLEPQMQRDMPLTDKSLYRVLWTKTYEADKS